MSKRPLFIPVYVHVWCGCFLYPSLPMSIGTYSTHSCAYTKVLYRKMQTRQSAQQTSQVATHLIEKNQTRADDSSNRCLVSKPLVSIADKAQSNDRWCSQCLGLRDTVDKVRGLRPTLLPQSLRIQPSTAQAEEGVVQQKAT